MLIHFVNELLYSLVARQETIINRPTKNRSHKIFLWAKNFYLMQKKTFDLKQWTFSYKQSPFAKTNEHELNR